MSGAYLRTRIVDISFAIYAPSWLVSVRLGRVYLVYNGLNGGRPAAASPVESVLTGGPDRPRPGSMVTVEPNARDPLQGSSLCTSGSTRIQPRVNRNKKHSRFHQNPPCVHVPCVHVPCVHVPCVQRDVRGSTRIDHS